MSSAAVNPIDNAQGWDVVDIAGRTSPGVCELSEVKRAYKYDIKEGRGTTGSTTTFVNKPPAKFSIKFKLWTAAHFEQWGTFRQLLKYDPTKKAAQAFDIYHPALADVEVKSVVTESIGSVVHEGDQLYSITVEFLEYLPASKRSAVSTPTGSQSSTSDAFAGTQADPALVALQQERDALAGQAQAAYQP